VLDPQLHISLPGSNDRDGSFRCLFQVEVRFLEMQRTVVYYMEENLKSSVNSESYAQPQHEMKVCWPQ
jgi:hypothetical protein